MSILDTLEVLKDRLNDYKSEDKQDIIRMDGVIELVILIDKEKYGLAEYLAEKNIYAKLITTHIKEANAELMSNLEKVRFIIVDTGTGLFRTARARADIEDTLGMCNKEMLALFEYSDIGSKKRGKKYVSWRQYKSINNLRNDILRLDEVYKNFNLCTPPINENTVKLEKFEEFEESIHKETPNINSIIREAILE